MRFRFTMWKMMLTVVVCLGGLVERQARLLKIARKHREAVRPILFCPGSALLRENWWHEEMWRKYDRAARGPWLLVAPDRPAPHVPGTAFDEDYPDVTERSR